MCVWRARDNCKSIGCLFKQQFSEGLFNESFAKDKRFKEQRGVVQHWMYLSIDDGLGDIAFHDIDIGYSSIPLFHLMIRSLYVFREKAIAAHDDVCLPELFEVCTGYCRRLSSEFHILCQYHSPLPVA